MTKKKKTTKKKHDAEEKAEKKKDVEQKPKHHFVHTTIEKEEDPSVEVVEDMQNDEEEVEEVVVEKKKKKKAKKPTKKELKQKIDSDLTAIYADHNGDIPDMKTFVKRRQRSFATAVAVLVFACVFLGTVAWLGFTVLQPKTQFSEEDMVLTISGNEEVKAGEEVTYRIRYRNAQNIQIDNAMLEVRYPKAFQFVTSTEAPSNEAMDTWELGAVDPQGSGFIDVTGRIFGNIDSEHSFRLFLNYQPANFSSEFQKVTQVTSKITESPVNIRVEDLDEVRPGKEIPFFVEVQFDTEDSVLPEKIYLELDGDIDIISSDPSLNEDGRWELSQTEEIELNITGAFSAEEGQTSTTISFVVLGEDEDGEVYVFSEMKHDVSMLETDIKGQLIINGTTDAVSVAPGDMVHASIVLENVSSHTFDDVEVRLRFDAPSYNKKSIFAWNRIDDIFDGDIAGEQIDDTMRRGEITWNAKHISDFSALAPGEKTIIDVRLPVKTSDDTDLNAFALHEGAIKFDVKYTKEDTVELFSGSEATLTFISDTALEVRDTKKGDTYGVTWVLTNSFHDLKDISLEADLFGDVSFDAEAISAPAGSVSYDDTSQKLTWTIQNMPVSIDVLALQFDVTLNDVDPSQKNVMSRVRGKATDAATGVQIDLIGDEVLVE